MAVKITITLTKDENTGTDENMVRTIGQLGQLVEVPLDKVVLNIACDSDEAEDVRDEVHRALSGRPMGIDAVIKTATEERIERVKSAKITPLDEMLREPRAEAVEG